MKKYLLVLACAAILIIAAAVIYLFTGGKTPAIALKGTSKPKVITTIFPQYDFARAVGGDKIELTMLLKPGMESHSYAPTPQDIVNIQNCDLFIYIGGENDVWADKILDSIDKEHRPQVLKLISCVSPVEEKLAEGMQAEAEDHDHDKEEEHAHGAEDKDGQDHNHDNEVEYDEHIWTSPRNAEKMTAAIMDKLILIDPQNRSAYEENTKAYIAELDRLDKDFRQAVSNVQRHRLIFGNRFPFRYLTDEYGLKYSAAFPGCAAESEASAATIAYLINRVKEEKIPVVFHIEMSNEKTADAICRETGARKMLLHACHNISREEYESGATYVKLMRKNLENIKEALN
ncbi:metal ABC transporter substrate-binding protein [Cloacibacillus sp.]